MLNLGLELNKEEHVCVHSHRDVNIPSCVKMQNGWLSPLIFLIMTPQDWISWSINALWSHHSNHWTSPEMRPSPKHTHELTHSHSILFVPLGTLGHTMNSIQVQILQWKTKLNYEMPFFFSFGKFTHLKLHFKKEKKKHTRVKNSISVSKLCWTLHVRNCRFYLFLRQLKHPKNLSMFSVSAILTLFHSFTSILKHASTSTLKHASILIVMLVWTLKWSHLQ